jgi:UDP-glucose 4-epimerase
VAIQSQWLKYLNIALLPIQEKHCSPLHFFLSASKMQVKHIVAPLQTPSSLRQFTLKFFNICGSRSGNILYSGVITKFLQKIINGEALTIDGDGEQTRGFIHVNAIVKAVILALALKRSNREVFNVCTPKPTSTNQPATTLKTVTGHKFALKYGPGRLDDIQNSFGDHAKATEN